MLLDSNIIIYAHKPEYQNIRDFLKNKQVAASAISYIEALGYPLISAEEKDSLQGFFYAGNSAANFRKCHFDSN